MNQKGFAPIFVILIILIVAGSGLIISKKINLTITNPQNNLKTIGQSSSDSAKPEVVKDKEQPKGNQQSANQNKNSPTPKATTQATKTGTLKGKVAGGYYLKLLPNTEVKIKGAGVEKTTKTDGGGIFTFSGLPVGSYNLSFSHPDYNISDLNNVTVSEGETFYNRTINGFLKVFEPTTIKGTVYVDHNDNRQKDSSDEGLDALFELDNKIGDNSWHLYQNITADKSGNFSVEIKDGSTYRLIPLSYTFYREPSSVEFVVDGEGGVKEFSFPYYPTSTTSKVTIYVFNDKNENNLQDGDEENIDYYYADITNISNGKNEKTSIVPEGVLLRNYDYGAYKVKLIPGNDAWASAYKITKSEDILTIANNSGDQTIKLGAHKLY